MQHEGEKELKCEACNVTFENEDAMSKHMSEAHGKTSDQDGGHDHEGGHDH